jgi:hypothetical protein
MPDVPSSWRFEQSEYSLQALFRTEKTPSKWWETQKNESDLDSQEILTLRIQELRLQFTEDEEEEF